MCKKQKAGYFRCMGLVTCIVSLAMIVGIIIYIVKGFVDNIGAWPIIAGFLNVFAVLGVGLGLTNLFFSHACLLEDNDY